MRIDHATEHQVQQMFQRFYPEQPLASSREFAERVAGEGKRVSMAQVQGYLMFYKSEPHIALQNCHDLWSLYCVRYYACAYGGDFYREGRAGSKFATSPKMAEGVDPLSESLQKLDDELTCPVCTDHFKEPKVLPCLHYYCKTCIADLIKRAKGSPFNCPQCRREVRAANNDANRYDSFLIFMSLGDYFPSRRPVIDCQWSCGSQAPCIV